MFQDSKFSPRGRGKDGATFEELARSSSSLVPEFVKACVEYIDAEGITTEGLYRVPGSRAHVEQLMDCFRDGKYNFIGVFFCQNAPQVSFWHILNFISVFDREKSVRC